MVVNVGTESTQAGAGLDPSQIATAVVLTDLPEVGEQILPDICGSSSANVHPDLNPRTGAGFLHLYGWMGIPMVLIFLLSAAWTIMLAVIQQIPTTYANYLMNTGDLDSGDFWILPRPEEHIVVPAIVLLALFGLGYVSLAVLMFFPDKLMPTLRHGQSCNPEYHKNRRSRWQVFSILSICRKSLRPVTMQSSEGEFESKVRPVKSRRNTMTAPTGFSWARVLYEVTSPHGLIRHYYNPLLDLPKLIFQTTTLATYLHHGFPIIVIFIYSFALYISWLVSSYRYKRVRPDPHFVIVRIFYSLDLFFAVFAPLEVLVYAYFTFQFDRAAFATRVATLNAGSFDRTARLFADPTQVSLFRIAFHYLQFTDAPMLLVKCALNALSIFKRWRVIVHLVEHARVVPPVGASVMLRATESQKLAKVRRRLYFQNLLIAATFFAAGTAVFIHSIVAVTSTMTVCEIHKQCKVMSYQWNVGAKHCSCIVFVDRDTAPKTIVEWENPIDTTANLAALAMSGHLEIIQIVNRQLPTLPEQLRKCHHLKEVILIYTKTLSFPDWAKEFTKMEYLHIQGDLTAKQLTYLPQNLFVDMTNLMFLHLGSLVKLPYVPDLSRLKRLEYLGLGMLHSVTEVPSLQNLINLRRVSIIDAIRLYSLPPTHHLRKLKTFALTAREPMCCNGYLTGKCDLTDFSCRNRTASGEPLVTCTTKRVDPLDYEVITSTNGIVCEKNLTFDLKDVKPTLAATDIACGGVLYKQCTLKSVQGMCFPTRMMAISCQINKNYIAMRRLQIQRRVGDKCDPAVEQWLGCTA